VLFEILFEEPQFGSGQLVGPAVVQNGKVRLPAVEAVTGRVARLLPE
jgi:hypothetical protein